MKLTDEQKAKITTSILDSMCFNSGKIYMVLDEEDKRHQSCLMMTYSCDLAKAVIRQCLVAVEEINEQVGE